MGDVPAFEAFYRAVHGRDPFPWQRRLAALVGREGWPPQIGVLTGLGKTACIDIAVWALAAQAARPPSVRTAATRIWYVVNRRLLVDAASDHADRLADLLANPESAQDRLGATASDAVVIRDVAGALVSVAALGTERGPLHVTRLRGGAELGARAPDPSQPTVVLATVPMFASRWLFRGYGTSRSMRPVDAAHAGIDSLVLLDEAHLARPLARLAGPLAQCDAGDPRDLLPPERARPQLVALTATGETSGDRFDLDDEDRAHPVVRERLDAAKPVELVEVPDKRIAATMAEHVKALLDRAGRPASCVAFTNTPGAARAVFDEVVRVLGEGADVKLLTGRTRDREAEATRRFVLSEKTGVPSGPGPGASRDKHLVVVATQTLEVGADLDFDLLVTETASVRALVQRFGRLNRLGQSNDIASAIICHPVRFTPGRLYGDEPAEVWQRLHAASQPGGPLGLGPAAIADVLGEPADIPPVVGELQAFHLWEWAKTSVPPVGEAPGHLFYEGLDPAPATVSVAWRAHVPASGDRLVPSLHGDEAIEVPIWELAEALDGHGVSLCRLAADRTTVEHVGTERIAPGDQVILSIDDGLYDCHGWSPTSTDRVLDISPIRDQTLVLSPKGVAGLLDPSANTSALGPLLDALTAGPNDDEDDWAERERVLVADLLDRMRDANPHPWLDQSEWHELLDALSSHGATLTRTIDGRTVPAAEPAPPFIQAPAAPRTRPRAEVRADAFDELSFGEEVQSPELDTHLVTVGTAAATIAERVGLPPDVVEAVRRAGSYHDLGKADPRFQRWLDPDGRAEALLAKSSTPQARREGARVAAGWPRGARHELLSARLLDEALAPSMPHRDLILHLVASHHGHGRPTVPVVDDAAPTKVRATVDDNEVVVPGDVSDPDWNQPARFRHLCDRYGYWGLALLEAVLRQADHAASAAAAPSAASEVL